MELRTFNQTMNFVDGSFSNPVSHQLGADPYSVQFTDANGISLDLEWKIDTTLAQSRIQVSAPAGGLANITVRILALANTQQVLLPIL